MIFSKTWLFFLTNFSPIFPMFMYTICPSIKCRRPIQSMNRKQRLKEWFHKCLVVRLHARQITVQLIIIVVIHEAPKGLEKHLFFYSEDGKAFPAKFFLEIFFKCHGFFPRGEQKRSESNLKYDYKYQETSYLTFKLWDIFRKSFKALNKRIITHRFAFGLLQKLNLISVHQANLNQFSFIFPPLNTFSSKSKSI